MLREEEKDQAPARNWKTYSRSISWTECPPKKSNTKPLWNSKARACLPPLQPLSIIRPSIEEWPRAGSDDLGVWPNPPTPGARLESVTPRENSTSDKAPTEFECRKDKLAFFNKECSRILDHIYLGSDAVAKNREILRHNGITHVLNCVGFVCSEYFKNELVYKTLWLQDCPSEDITSILYDVFDYFEDVQEQGGRVLVHCCQGVSRSTSLVIAYLMWKEGLSFDDAFQHVKAARGVTNPNVGFACQLLQCQKRVHALPASPTSVLRMYRMAPHSPYDPLHLVPKLLCEPGADRLDSRGGFIVHIPSALYVWTGKHCPPMMSDNARAAASQVILYEKFQGPVITVKEGEEAFEFWDALFCGKSSTDGCHVKFKEENRLLSATDVVLATTGPCLGERKLLEYDFDFEIFHRALTGGVVPPFPLSETGTETRLPARENGWNRFRRKLTSGVVKEYTTSSKLNCGTLQICDEPDMGATGKDVFDDPVYASKEDFVSTDLSVPSSSHCDSPDSFASCITGRSCWMENNLKEVEFPAPLSDTSLSRSPSFNVLDSFSTCPDSKLASSSTSPSLSPSTSDYCSSFTFSPSSSNWSDMSFVSAQPSPYGLEPRDGDPGMSGSVEECVCNVDSSQTEQASSASFALRTAGLCSTCRETLPSLAERRWSSPPPQMILPSIDEAPKISENISRSLYCLEDDVLSDVESNSFSPKVSFELVGEEPISDANSYVADNEVLCKSRVEKKYDTSHLVSDYMIATAEANNLVFYKWPSWHKMDMNYDILDSRSVYVILMPTVSFGPNIADVLYVWIGRNVSLGGSQSQLIINDSINVDSHTHVEALDHNFLTKKGFCTDAQIKIVKEGEEPVELLKHLACFSVVKDLNGGIKYQDSQDLSF